MIPQINESKSEDFLMCYRSDVDFLVNYFGKLEV